ncbi:MAG: MBOAT family protein [Dorea sp.]|jgi:alginate O-acetyltransferase complex protein AlgI|nr:MBOAT family protein [Dorea sp.]
MLFSSIVFLFTFLPIILVLYYLVPRIYVNILSSRGIKNAKERYYPAVRTYKNIVVLSGSLIFYAWGEPVYLFLMVFSIMFNYISGLDIARNLKNKEKAKRSLIYNVGVNLLILGFFKYEGFLLDSINAVLPVDIPFRELPLPIGISFYTFQILSYIIDVYRGEVEVQKNLIDFAVYVTMFPQLIAGPIVQYADIDRQLHARKETIENFGEGTLFFIRGLSKKVLLANTIGMVFQKVSLMDAEQVSVLSAWLGCAAYTFQIYFDFSGYSDMAVGLGKMLGFEFKKNFFYPYVSTSITEFWRRWHISLSTWFRDYVYIPLGGNRVSKRAHVRNIMVVWMLTGLWHGAAWNFVIWGLYYGILLLIEKYILTDVIEKIPMVVRHIYCLAFVMIGWVFFFSPTLGSAVDYLKLMVGAEGHGFIDKQGLYILMTNGWMWVMLVLGSTPAVHDFYEGFIYSKGQAKMKAAVNCAIYAILFLLCVAYLVTESYNPFLYFRF